MALKPLDLNQLLAGKSDLKFEALLKLLQKIWKQLHICAPSAILALRGAFDMPIDKLNAGPKCLIIRT